MTRLFSADFSQFSAIISHIREGLLSLGCDEETVGTAHVICDEFITNIIKNAYPPDCPDTRCIDGADCLKPLKIACAKTADRVSIELTDWGQPFNPLEYSGDTSSIGHHGGFGINLARGLADDITYLRTSDSNVLTFFLTLHEQVR